MGDINVIAKQFTGAFAPSLDGITNSRKMGLFLALAWLGR
jgi:hypothetical protein